MNSKRLIKTKYLVDDGKLLRENFPEQYEEIFNLTNFLDESVLFLERVYCWRNQIRCYPLCPECGSMIKRFNKQTRYGFWSCCSSECLKSYQKKKREQTNLEKYGCKSPFGSIEVIERMKENWIKRYGVDNPFKVKFIQQRARTTLFERYGVRSTFQLDSFKKRVNEKYDVDNVFQNEEIKSKMKETWIKNYGVDNPSKSVIIQEKIKKTNIYRYGKEYTFFYS